MGFAGRQGYVSSMPGPPIHLPSSQKINTRANIGSLVKRRLGLSGRIAPVCIVFFEELRHDAIRESKKQSGSISGSLGQHTRGLERR